MASDKTFARNYLLLEPKEATLYDLMSILFRSNMRNRTCVDSSDNADIEFHRRLLIFLSLLAQLVLAYILKLPMSWIGSVLEILLNLVSTNGGFLGLLRNMFKARVIIPSRESPTFLSVIGNLDKRTELDGDIKKEDARYKVALSLMSSKIAYENKAFIDSVVSYNWKMEFLGFYDFWNDYQDKCTTQAFLLRDTTVRAETIVVAFRGTEPFDADQWSTDVDISWFELPGTGRIHAGFMKALGLQRNRGWPNEITEESHKGHEPPAYYAVRQILRELLRKNDDTKFIVTGHSLGGALAILFPAILAMHGEEWMLDKLEAVYTFGQPRVGDEEFGKFASEHLRKHDVKYIRHVYNNDLVPRLPYDNAALMYKHFGRCIYFNSIYRGEGVWEEPNKNYFSLQAAIPMFFSAVWELIRSFISGYIWGPSYKEGWFMRVYRVFGLLVPGLPDHAPQDYDSSSRLMDINGSRHFLQFLETTNE